MSDRRDQYAAESPGGVIHVRPDMDLADAPPNTLDALSEPAADLIAEQLAALLPPGAAWRSPDGAAFDFGGRMGGFVRAFSWGLGDLYRAAYRMALESTATTLSESLADWETDHGLPDPCLAEDGTRATRLAALIAKIRSMGTITPQDFVDLAARLGHEITITEPDAFACGESECGVDPIDPDAEFYWIVKPAISTGFYFEAGVSELGVDALSDFVPLLALECVFRRVAPAWTRVIFDYS